MEALEGADEDDQDLEGQVLNLLGVGEGVSEEAVDDDREGDEGKDDGGLSSFPDERDRNASDSPSSRWQVRYDFFEPAS
jgi:hypothetical protein